MRGNGYQLIDMKGKVYGAFEGTVPGIYRKMESARTRAKRVVLSNVVDSDGNVISPFEVTVMVGDENLDVYIGTTLSMTVTDEDEIDTPEDDPEEE